MPYPLHRILKKQVIKKMGVKGGHADFILSPSLYFLDFLLNLGSLKDFLWFFKHAVKSQYPISFKSPEHGYMVSYLNMLVN